MPNPVNNNTDTGTEDKFKAKIKYKHYENTSSAKPTITNESNKTSDIFTKLESITNGYYYKIKSPGTVGLAADTKIIVSKYSTPTHTVSINFRDNSSLNLIGEYTDNICTKYSYTTGKWKKDPTYTKPNNNGIYITQCSINPNNNDAVSVEINPNYTGTFTPTITIVQDITFNRSYPDNDSSTYGSYTFPIPRGNNKGGEIFTKWQSGNSYYYEGNSCSTRDSMDFIPIYTDGKFNLSVNLNGGTTKVTLKDTFTYGTPVDFTNNIYNKNIYRNGYTFNGFEIESGSGTFGNNYNPYIPNCIYNSDGTSDTIIKATWKPNTYTITYKLNYKKPILGTGNTTDTKVNFFNGSRVILDDKVVEYNENDNHKSSNQYSDYTINGNNHILKLNESAKNQSITFKEWLVGYEYTKGSGNFPNEVTFSVDKNNTQLNLNNYDTLTPGVSLNDKYGNGALVLDVLPISYEITYTESIPQLRLDDGNLIKILWNQKNVEIELKPESDLPTNYTILDDPKDLFNTRLLKEDKSIIANIETNKLKLGLDRGLYYNGNLKSKDNYSFLKLTENNKGINGPYQDYGKLYFTQEYKLSKFKFIFNYKYNGDEYPSVDSDEFVFMSELTNPFSKINLTPKVNPEEEEEDSNNFTFDGWVDSVGVKVIDKDGNITNSGNKELKYFWGKKNSNNQYTYYLIAEKNEDPNNPRIIDLYPKWVRQSGLKVFDGKEWQYPTENGNTNIDNIKINDVDWNNIKEMKVYDGTDWKPVNLNHRPPDPDENTYEEI